MFEKSQKKYIFHIIPSVSKSVQAVVFSERMMYKLKQGHLFFPVLMILGTFIFVDVTTGK